MKCIRIPKDQKVIKRINRQEKDIRACQYLESITTERHSLHKELTRKSNLVL